MAMTRSQKRARKARKQGGLDMPELKPSRKRDKSGCFVDRTRQQKPVEPDPRTVSLSARCRHLGKEDTEENRLSVSWSILGDPAGRAISLGSTTDEDRQRMWDTFIGLDRAVAAYHHRILGQSRFAKIGKTEYIPDRFETTPEESAHSDARDDATKDRDTVNAWTRWHGYVMQMSSPEQTVVWDALWLRTELTKGGALTVAGQSFVRAMRVLAGIVSGGRSI